MWFDQVWLYPQNKKIKKSLYCNMKDIRGYEKKNRYDR